MKRAMVENDAERKGGRLHGLLLAGSYDGGGYQLGRKRVSVSSTGASRLLLPLGFWASFPQSF
jgi:hypothetical protein